ncbi:Uncharacterized protein PECH_006212 [Penicillium ucsense]|uniref:Autophagy-related protein Atg28 n=1 Tax=Penicillium ucsense TaxID=2839758 RepID=A0A8J8WI16_9EURO|nr:Uncharacterized protein PECM_006536 [Penicillium ucsense]KAF7735745.1 Uncharacterized protein PECH_006212 [Penicillium ucsense]
MSTLLPLRGQRAAALPDVSPVSLRDPLLQIERQASLIQRILQDLIDAQSEGLAGGLGQPSLDSTSTVSPTNGSVALGRASSPATPARRQSSTRISLRKARQGISRSILDLLKLRETESAVLSFHEEERDNALEEIRDFLARKRGLQEAISSVRNDQQSQEAHRLRQEATSLETEIGDLETKLYEMKAHHRNLIVQISSIENSVGAKRSSYTESLSLLQSDVDSYLRNPPVQQLAGFSNESSIYTLKPDRRTLELAEEQWKLEREQLHTRHLAVDAEIVALEEGGDIWRQAVADLSTFESLLRTQMRLYIERQSSLVISEGEPLPLPLREIAAKVSTELDKTASRLESFLELANRREWKLLVCCLSAEVEALHEARGILLPVFGIPVRLEAASSNGASSDDDSPAGPKITRDGLSREEEDRERENRDSEPPADLLQDDSNHTTHPILRSDDDEPDPAWL